MKSAYNMNSLDRKNLVMAVALAVSLAVYSFASLGVDGVSDSAVSDPPTAITAADDATMPAVEASGVADDTGAYFVDSIDYAG